MNLLRAVGKDLRYMFVNVQGAPWIALYLLFKRGPKAALRKWRELWDSGVPEDGLITKVVNSMVGSALLGLATMLTLARQPRRPILTTLVLIGCLAGMIGSVDLFTVEVTHVIHWKSLDDFMAHLAFCGLSPLLFMLSFCGMLIVALERDKEIDLRTQVFKD